MGDKDNGHAKKILLDAIRLAGVFVKTGSVTIHMNDGQIASVEKKEKVA